MIPVIYLENSTLRYTHDIFVNQSTITFIGFDSPYDNKYRVSIQSVHYMFYLRDITTDNPIMFNSIQDAKEHLKSIYNIDLFIKTTNDNIIKEG